MTENTNTFAARLRELSRAASAGPWMYVKDDEGSSMGWIYTTGGSPLFDVRGDSAAQFCAAELAVTLRNHADRLADLVERVEAYRALVGDAVLPTTTTDKGIAIYAAKSAMLAALDLLNGGGA